MQAPLGPVGSQLERDMRRQRAGCGICHHQNPEPPVASEGQVLRVGRVTKRGVGVHEAGLDDETCRIAALRAASSRVTGFVSCPGAACHRTVCVPPSLDPPSLDPPSLDPPHLTNPT